MYGTSSDYILNIGSIIGSLVYIKYIIVVTFSIYVETKYIEI